MPEMRAPAERSSGRLLYFLPAAFVLTIAFTFAPLATRAMQYPLTPQQVQAAISFGRAHSPSQVVGMPELNFRDSSGWKPSVNIITPWANLAFDASYANANYQDLNNATIKADSKSSELRVSAYAFDPNDVDSNENAVIVISQDGKILHPLTISVGEKSVSEYPVVGYTTPIRSRFSCKALKLDEPFTVIVANVLIGEYQTGEVRYEVDPRTFN